MAKTYRNITNLLTSVAAVAVGVSGLTACSDDRDNVPFGAEDNHIVFSVNEGTGWNNAMENSRSGYAGVSPAGVLTLQSGENQYYLIPRIEEGINTGKGEKALSRGTTVTVDGMNSFGVYASINDGNAAGGSFSPDYMFNVEITRENGWKPKAEYLWPGSGSLHFNAYSPYCSSTGDEGIISLPGMDATSPYKLTYQTPQDVASQQDLLYAVPVDASASPCDLTFNHALTAIRFATGAEMAPCTVKSISITGIADKGELNLETGEWDSLSGSSSFTVVPDKVLTAVTGEKYVASDVDITSEEETFILLPQTLAADAEIEMTIEVDGKESTFNASLDGQTWTGGKTLTYRLSANPTTSGLILEILDASGNPVTSITSPYTGGTTEYTVRSYSDDGTGTTVPVEWEASFITPTDKTETECPSWIIGYGQEGSGESVCNLVTDLPEPIFLSMSENTKKLRDAQDVNTATGLERYNLSNSTGATTVENTANCYIINAAGKYSLPLVYGNAVKNGVKNESAYISTLAQTAGNKTHALFHFVNHLGNEISDPYIYNNASCAPHDAVMIWEDRINLVRNVALSQDGHSLEFEIPAASIRQGNALLAVRDAEGTVMWSWQIWITDYKPSENTLSIPQNGTYSYLYARSLGTIYEGDLTEFKEGDVIMRLTQKNVPDGLEALSIDIPVSQEGKTIDTGDCYSFYQFGRKDAMVTGLDQYYDSDHNEMNSNSIPTADYGTNQLEMIEKSIREPQVFFTGSTSSVRPYYLNLWDISHLRLTSETPMPENIKTIYDPSPVGAKVPIGNVFRTITADETQMTYDETTEMATFTVDGVEFSFLALGYRQPTGGEPGHKGFGSYWTAAARSNRIASYLSIDSRQLHRTMTTNMPLYGFAVRPVLEQ